MLGARRVEELEEVAGAIRATGGRAVAVRTDVTAERDCAALVAAGVSEFGRVDGLVNNAGTGGEYHVVEDDPLSTSALWWTST